MSTGKYSPTVSRWYADDQEWFRKNGGGFANGINPNSELDDEGFDSYGYNDDVNGADGVDRAGFSEGQYLTTGAWLNEDYYPTLYNSILDEWYFGKQTYKHQKQKGIL